MRHIDRLPTPRILSEKQNKWQQKYEQKIAEKPKARPDSSKYAHKDIRQQLNSCSFNKCFYCESKLTGTPREVDHYIEVAIDPSGAFEWTNLYLSCNNCNDKLDHNTVPVAEALNPCVDSDDEIQRHITFERECIRSQAGSEKGLNTIRKFRLDSDALDLKRSKWLNKLATIVIEIDNQMREENRTVHSFEEKDRICRFMQSDQPYSLMCEKYIRTYISWAVS